MVSSMRYIFLFALLLLLGCGKKEFTLEFQLDENVTGNYDVTYYAHDQKGGFTVQAVASVREGKCMLPCTAMLPTLVYVTTKKYSVPLVIYACKGEKIEIEGNSEVPMEWEVAGNEINIRLSEWRKKNSDTLASHNADSLNVAIRHYVEENSSDPVSLILMLCYFDRNKDELQYNSLMASLNGEAKKDEWLETAGRSDQLYHSYSYPARLESLIMKSIQKHNDTIAVNGRDPVLMMFWQTGYNERKGMIDSLRVIEKDYPNSVRIIADVCVDVDSIAWRNALRKDSLDKVKRLWSPLGYLDPTLMKLKVKSLPYFIVFDKDGHQSYRGVDISEAMKEYRLLQESEE